MGHVQKIRSGKKVFFVVELFLPGTCVSSRLLDGENLGIAVSLVSGASMSKSKCVRVIEHPDPTDDYIFQSRMECTRENATALLATGFGWDEDAADIARGFQIPGDTIESLRKDIKRIHRENCYKESMYWLYDGILNTAHDNSRCRRKSLLFSFACWAKGLFCKKEHDENDFWIEAIGKLELLTEVKSPKILDKSVQLLKYFLDPQFAIFSNEVISAATRVLKQLDTTEAREILEQWQQQKKA